MHWEFFDGTWRNSITGLSKRAMMPTPSFEMSRQPVPAAWQCGQTISDADGERRASPAPLWRIWQHCDRLMSP
jgi:hypothetical protein